MEKDGNKKNIDNEEFNDLKNRIKFFLSKKEKKG